MCLTNYAYAKTEIFVFIDAEGLQIFDFRRRPRAIKQARYVVSKQSKIEGHFLNYAS